jgi:hypothetical protein
LPQQPGRRPSVLWKPSDPSPDQSKTVSGSSQTSNITVILSAKKALSVSIHLTIFILSRNDSTVVGLISPFLLLPSCGPFGYHLNGNLSTRGPGGTSYVPFIYIIARNTTKPSHVAKQSIVTQRDLNDPICAHNGARYHLVWLRTQIIGHDTSTAASPNAVSVLV